MCLYGWFHLVEAQPFKITSFGGGKSALVDAAAAASFSAFSRSISFRIPAAYCWINQFVYTSIKIVYLWNPNNDKIRFIIINKSHSNQPHVSVCLLYLLFYLLFSHVLICASRLMTVVQKKMFPFKSVLNDGLLRMFLQQHKSYITIHWAVALFLLLI